MRACGRISLQAKCGGIVRCRRCCLADFLCKGGGAGLASDVRTIPKQLRSLPSQRFEQARSAQALRRLTRLELGDGALDTAKFAVTLDDQCPHSSLHSRKANLCSHFHLRRQHFSQPIIASDTRHENQEQYVGISTYSIAVGMDLRRMKTNMSVALT